jgi:hypothetical protein
LRLPFSFDPSGSGVERQSPSVPTFDTGAVLLDGKYGDHRNALGAVYSAAVQHARPAIAAVHLRWSSSNTSSPSNEALINV